MLVVVLLPALAACRGGEAPAVPSLSAATAGSAQATVTDSSYNSASLARLRATISAAPAALDGPTSRDDLVRSFARALEAGDREALTRLTLSPAEFAYLYYPESPLAQPPYGLDPETMWMQVSSRSERGLTRLLRERSGQALGYIGYECEPEPMRSRSLTMWNTCVVQRQGGVREPLFGSIVERDGRFKFVGLANRL